MFFDYRKYWAVIRSLLFVWLFLSGSTLKAQLEEPRPESPTTEAPTQSRNSSDDSELKIHNYQLKRAKAAEVLKLWKQLHGMKNGATIDERTNSIVFFANDEAARELGESLALLDSETPSPIIPPTPVAQGSAPEARFPAKSQPAGPFRKYTFKHAKAADVLKILREAAGSTFDEDVEGFIVDERTNSFIWKIIDGSLNFEEECRKLDCKSPEEEDQLHNQERYSRVPVIGPITEGGAPIALDPPSDDEVLQALEKARPTRGGLPLLPEKHGHNMKIVKEKIADYVDPPRYVPLIGMAQLHHAHYKCTTYFSEQTINGWPVPNTLEDKEASEVIYIDHNHFHLCGNGPSPASRAPQASQTYNFSMGFERGESLEFLKQRYSELEQQTHQLADKLKQSKSPSETERKELQLAVRKSFEARQALQRAELADLAQRMKSMQQSIDLRDKLADEVVEQRVEDLLNPNLKWEVPQSATPTLSQATQRPEPDAVQQPIARAVWEIVNQLPLGDDRKLPFGIVLTEIEPYPKEQLAGFKEEIREQIFSELKTYGHLIVASRRVAEATLFSLRLKAKDLFLPNQQAKYLEALEKEGKSAQSILFAKLIRDDPTSYLLALELKDRSGRVYKSTAKVSKTNPVNSIALAKSSSLPQSIPPTPISAPGPPDWNEWLKQVPESGTALVMFSFEPETKEQMLSIAQKVAAAASVQLIELPRSQSRDDAPPTSTHFLLMKDRALIGIRSGVITETGLREFVAEAKNWLTPHSTGVDENSLVRVDCYIFPGAGNIGNQHGAAFPITMAVIAVHEDQAVLLGPDSVAEYMEKGYACVAVVRDAAGKQKQLPLEVLLKGPVKLLGRNMEPHRLQASVHITNSDGTSRELPIANILPDLELMPGPLEKYDVDSAIYHIRGVRGLKPVKLAAIEHAIKVDQRVLSGSFARQPTVPPILGFSPPMQWQTQTVQSVDGVFGGNMHGPELFDVLCPTLPVPSGFTFNDHGRLIGKYGTGSPCYQDMTHTVFKSHATHSILQAALEKISDTGLKAALAETLNESQKFCEAKPVDPSDLGLRHSQRNE